jgi:hypothetical protein
MISRKLFFAAFCGALLLCPVWLAAQQQQESVAEAARRAQAQKKPDAKPVVVITNDTLDTIKGSVSVVGQEPAAAPAAPADSSGKAATTDKEAQAKAAPAAEQKPPVKDEAYWKPKFADARKKLADDEHELDILQREYNLKQQQYYSDPNTAMRQQYNRQDLTDTQTKINEKTAAVAQDKQAISDLEDSLRQSGGDPGWATAP